MLTYGSETVLSAISRLVTTHPRRVLVATVVFLALAIALGAPVTGQLSVDPDLDFVDPQSESNVTYDELRDAVGRGLSPGIIVLVASDGPGPQPSRPGEAAPGGRPDRV